MRPHGQLRGLGRILAGEVNISDLLQYLTDLDPQPWGGLVDAVDPAADREYPLKRLPGDRSSAGAADLVLHTDDGRPIAIEVKIGHSFSEDQRQRYEMSTDGPLFLAAMESDRTIVDRDDRWSFLRLADIFRAWLDSESTEAAASASAVVPILEAWDATVEGVFRPGGADRLDGIEHKFLARLVSRRITCLLQQRGWMAWAGVSSGRSGLALVQAYAALNGDRHRCVMAEIRWLEGLQRADFRLGVDFDMDETPQTRAEVWELAKQMTAVIRLDAYRDHLHATGDRRAALFPDGEVSGRQGVVDEAVWLPVIDRGFKSSYNPGGVAGGRKMSPPGFAGDRAQRFQAVGKIDLGSVDANDLVDLLEQGLRHLCAHLPAGYRCALTTDPRSATD